MTYQVSIGDFALKKRHKDAFLIKVAEFSMWGATGWVLSDNMLLSFLYAFVGVWFGYWLVDSREGNVTFRREALKLSQCLATQSARIAMEKMAHTGTFLIRLSFAITGISLLLLLTSLVLIYQDNAVKNDPLLQSARMKIEQAQDALQIKQSSSPYSDSEVALAYSEKGRLQQDLQTIQAELESANQAKMAGFNTTLESFWNSKNSHAKTLTNRSVMDKNCNAKSSPYGGGKLKTAARTACNELQGILATKPGFLNEPRIVNIKNRLSTISKILSYEESTKMLKRQVTASIDNLAAIERQLNNGVAAKTGMEFMINAIQKIQPAASELVIIMCFLIAMVILILQQQAYSNCMSSELNTDHDLRIDGKTYVSMETVDGVSFKERIVGSFNVFRVVVEGLKSLPRRRAVAIVLPFVVIFVFIFYFAANTASANTNAGGNMLVSLMFFIAILIVCVFIIVWNLPNKEPGNTPPKPKLPNGGGNGGIPLFNDLEGLQAQIVKLQEQNKLQTEVMQLMMREFEGGNKQGDKQGDKQVPSQTIVAVSSKTDWPTTLPITEPITEPITLPITEPEKKKGISIHKRVLQFKRTPQFVKSVGKPPRFCHRDGCKQRLPNTAHHSKKYCCDDCAKLVQAEQRKLKREATVALRKRA